MRADEVLVTLDAVALPGELAVPDDPRGVVAFAHGSGSSRHSPRNRQVAGALHDAGLATLLFDLLSAEEEVEDLRTRALRFDIPLLAERLVGAVRWLAEHDDVTALPIALFGASTGAAAALIAAAREPQSVRAVVSRGGRPDLAGDALARVQAPVLLIVGGADEIVLDLNRRAAAELVAPHEVAVVPGATHLFEEWGALEQVSRLAADWLTRHLPG